MMLQRSEVRSQKSEVRSQRSGAGSRGRGFAVARRRIGSLLNPSSLVPTAPVFDSDWAEARASGRSATASAEVCGREFAGASGDANRVGSSASRSTVCSMGGTWCNSPGASLLGLATCSALMEGECQNRSKPDRVAGVLFKVARCRHFLDGMVALVGETTPETAGETPLG